MCGANSHTPDFLGKWLCSIVCSFGARIVLIRLAKFYSVTTDYLLGLTETKRHPNAELAGLRLSDDMIDVLKEGRADTALLGELVAHKDFMKLMAGINVSAALVLFSYWFSIKFLSTCAACARVTSPWGPNSPLP